MPLISRTLKNHTRNSRCAWSLQVDRPHDVQRCDNMQRGAFPSLSPSRVFSMAFRRGDEQAPAADCSTRAVNAGNRGIYWGPSWGGFEFC
jgi:hypothetical protein